VVSPEPQNMLGLREPPAVWVIPPAKHVKGGEQLAITGVILTASCRFVVEGQKLFYRLWTRHMRESTPNVLEFNKQWKNSS